MEYDDLHRRALATARIWAETCHANDWWLSPDGRVGLHTAAGLLGIKPGSVRNMVAAGSGPPTYKIGGGGHKRTVRLLELAEWLESKKAT